MPKMKSETDTAQYMGTQPAGDVIPNRPDNSALNKCGNFASSRFRGQIDLSDFNVHQVLLMPNAGI